MPRLRKGPAYALNVGSMTCISPLDGMPIFALISVRLIALGFPPDSVCICFMKTPNSDDTPSMSVTACISPAHWPVPPPPPPPKRPLKNPPTLPATEPSADRALPGSAVIAAKPLPMSPASADGQPPKTIFTMPPASLASPLNSPATRLPPTPSMTVLGLWMPKKRLTAPTIGWTITRLTHPAIPRIAPVMPLSSPATICPPRVAQPRTAATPHAAIWPGSRENQPARLDQAVPRAREMVPTTLDHQRATVEVTNEAIDPMKLATLVKTEATVRKIALTVPVMKLRICVQYRMTSTTARPTGPVRMPTISGQFRDSQLSTVRKMPGMVTVKNWVNGPANQRTTAITTSLTPLNAASTITRKVRDRVHSR